MLIIGLHGKIKAGKTTVAHHLVKHHEYEEIAFADELKSHCKTKYDLTHDQLYTQSGKETVDPRYDMSPRQILQKEGTIMRNCDLTAKYSYFVSIVLEKIEKIKKISPHKFIIVSDVRYEDEAAMIRSLGGYIISITRDLNIKDSAYLHESENQHIVSDFKLINNSTKQILYKKVDDLMKYILMLNDISKD